MEQDINIPICELVAQTMLAGIGPEMEEECEAELDGDHVRLYEVNRPDCIGSSDELVDDTLIVSLSVYENHRCCLVEGEPEAKSDPETWVRDRAIRLLAEYKADDTCLANWGFVNPVDHLAGPAYQGPCKIWFTWRSGKGFADGGFVIHDDGFQSEVFASRSEAEAWTASCNDWRVDFHILKADLCPVFTVALGERPSTASEPV